MPPLHKVSIYALEEDVTQMQRLLLVYGAVETQAEKNIAVTFGVFGPMWPHNAREIAFSPNGARVWD